VVGKSVAELIVPSLDLAWLVLVFKFCVYCPLPHDEPVFQSGLHVGYSLHRL